MNQQQIIDIYTQYEMLSTGNVPAILALAEVLTHQQHGSLVLSNGRHSVDVKLKHEPCKVFISLRSNGEQVCGGSMDMANAQPTPQGFALTAEVQSSMCFVDWLVE